MLKFLKHLLNDLKRLFYHLVNYRCYRAKHVIYVSGKTRQLKKNKQTNKQKNPRPYQVIYYGTDHDTLQIKVDVIITWGLIDQVIPWKLKFALSTTRKENLLITRKVHLLIAWKRHPLILPSNQFLYCQISMIHH